MTNSKATDAPPTALHPALAGVRAVLFDMGGTLSHPDWPRLARAAEAVGGTLTPAAIERAMKEVLRGVDADFEQSRAPAPDTLQRHWVFRRMYTALGLEADACEQICAGLDAAHAERHLWSLMDEDAPHVLTALKERGLLLGVISNTEEGQLAALLDLVKLTAHFDVQLDSFVVGVRKPDPAIFQLALAQLGVAPDEAAFVGDSYWYDALAARAAGMRAVLLDPFELYPDCACTRIRRLRDLLDANAVA